MTVRTATPAETAGKQQKTWWHRAARRAMDRQLEGLERGRLTLVDGASERVYGTAGGLEAELRVEDPRSYTKVLFGGSLGAAEAYLEGWWTTPDLPRVIEVFLQNLAATDQLESGFGRIRERLARGYHWLRRNSRRGSRRNIHEHYDLGNDFFELFLDESMTYSCAIFESPETSLREASLAKLDRVCRKLELQPEHHVVEIGSGWGSFALHAAKHYGCRVTTTTISTEQYERACARIAAENLGERVTVLCEDYRDLEGRYDRLVSIEMIEAIGHRQLATFFGKCSELLKDDGRMVLQSITFPDHRYDLHRRTVDFIKRYVFPGSTIPSVSAMCQAMARSTDLRVEHLEEIGPHYAETLKRWRENFLERLDDVRQLGHSERFLRLWEYYLAYCEAGFRERYIGNVQIVLAKPDCRLDSILQPRESLARG